MSKSKNPGNGRSAKDSKANQTTTRPPAAKEAVSAAEAAKAAESEKGKSNRSRSAAKSSFLDAEDFKHFREVFRKKRVLDKEIVEDAPIIPPVPTETGPEQVKPGRRAKRRGRGPQKSPTKVLTSIRLDQHVYDYFKASGRGWQSRINDLLVTQMQKEIRSQKRKERAAAKSAAKHAEGSTQD